VSTILSGETREAVVDLIHNKLSEVGEQVKDGKIPLDQYLITKVNILDNKRRLLYSGVLLTGTP